MGKLSQNNLWSTKTKRKVKKVAVIDTKVKLTDVKEKKGSQRTRIAFKEQE